jgi:hypothetical protein
MHGVYYSLAAVVILTSGYSFLWLFCPDLHAWMESPRDRFVECQRRFPEIVRGNPSPPTDEREITTNSRPQSSGARVRKNSRKRA